MHMRKKQLLLTLFITLLLTACGKSETAVIESSPPASLSIESTSAPTDAESTQAPLSESSPTPQTTVEPSQAPAATAEITTPKPTAAPTPEATAKATPKATVKPTPKPTATPQVNGEAAEALYKMSCTSCHGVNLEGDFGPNLQNIGGSLTKNQIVKQITDGGDAMPAFKESMSEDEIQTLSAWLAAKK